MKKIFWMVFGLTLFFTFSLHSHPAGSITIDYNRNTRQLTVTMMHDTKDAKKHFIGHVEISLNSKKIIQQDFFSQIDTDRQQSQYTVIDAKSGDEINVLTVCNVFGKKEQKILVP